MGDAHLSTVERSGFAAPPRVCRPREDKAMPSRFGMAPARLPIALAQR